MVRSVGLSLLLSVAVGAALAQDGPPPVVLINGFDLGAVTSGECSLEEDSAGTFGRLQELLESDGRTVIFFDNCRFGAPSIETLGQALGGIIAELDRPVDLIGFSLGGLVVRSYLAGKSPDAVNEFHPPPNPRVRKAILVATPNFGSPLASLVPSGIQGPQMREGSRFSWELARWHQGEDDLREVDALAIAGDGGRGRAGDGVVSLVSASLASFGRPGERTRAIEACHNRIAFILCDVRETMIEVLDQEHPTGRIIRAFLADDPTWRDIGVPVSAHPAGEAGVYFATADASGELREEVGDAVAVPADAMLAEERLSSGDPGIFFSRSLGGGSYALSAADEDADAVAATLTQGATSTILAKPGPLIARVIPAAGLIDTLSLAPNSLISVFGKGFTAPSASFGATATPLPTEFEGLSVRANDEPLGLIFANANQINAYLRPGLTGLIRLSVRTDEGGHAVDALISDSALAVFALNGGGFGPAAAIEALSGAVIAAESPARVGGFVSIFVTGLGQASPRVTLGAVEQRVLFAGDAPGFLGLQQINIEVGEGTPTGENVELAAFASGRRSNGTTLAVAGAVTQ